MLLSVSDWPIIITGPCGAGGSAGGGQHGRGGGGWAGKDRAGGGEAGGEGPSEGGTDGEGSTGALCTGFTLVQDEEAIYNHGKTHPTD